MKYWLPLLAFCAFFPFATLAEEKESAAEKQESTAEAQETAPAASDAMENQEDVENFDVIGSHIKKTNIEGPSPVLVIDRDQIEMSGYNSVGDVLRDLPVASQGGQREAALEYPSTWSGTSLRGMKGRDVLILLNYRRLPPIGGSNSVDLSVIPLSVVEKIEILKDGASALYGSDAVGGVINIVTKKGAVGGQVNIQGSLTQREEGNTGSAFASFVDFWDWNAEDDLNAWNGKGDKFSIDASYGGNVNDINYMVGGQIKLNSAIYLKDRKFSAITKKDFSSFGSPGTWLDGDTYKAFPGCPAESLSEDGKCKWDYSPYMQSTPRIMQGSVFAYADTELASDIRISTTVTYSYLNSLSTLAPPPLVALATDGVPADIARAWGLPVQGSENVSIFYRPVREEGVGQRKFDLNNHSYQAQLNLEMDLLNTMELEGNLHASGSHYFTEATGFLSRKKLFELTNQGKFNPTLSDDKKNDLSYAAVTTEKFTSSNLFSFDPKLSGEVGEIAGQPLSFAVGSTAAYQRYKEGEGNEDVKKLLEEGDKILGGDTNVEGEGDRIFGSLYGELALQLFEMVDLQLAARTDYYHYSDSDSASGFTEQDIPFLEDYTMPVSPRAALSFQPVEEVKLRASWGMGFRAPSLVTIHQGKTTTHPFSVDYIKCPVYDKSKEECGRRQYNLNLSGNKELRPETSQSINLGIVFQPVKQLSFNVDYFRTNRQNLILFYNDSPSLDTSVRDVLKYEQKKGVEALKARGVNLERNEAGDVSQITTTPLNAASDLVHGIDAEIDASLQLAAGWDLGLSLSHSHILYNEYQVFSDSDLEVPIDWDGSTWPGMPRWKNTATISFMNKDMGHSFQLIVHNIPSQYTLPDESEEETEHYWQLDVAGKLALTDNMDLTVGISNLLGFDRPQNEDRNTSTGYLDSFLYSVRGRMLNARLTYNFQ